jgi:two-component sensor histidine kinase
VPEGRVALGWEHQVNDGSEFVLSWTEIGGPPAREPGREGFGLKFLRQSAQHELKGTLSLDFAEDGLKATLRVANDRLLAPSGTGAVSP